MIDNESSLNYQEEFRNRLKHGKGNLFDLNGKKVLEREFFEGKLYKKDFNVQNILFFIIKSMKIK